MSDCGQQWTFRKEYGNRSSLHCYFLQFTLPGNWTADCINIFLFKCPFNLIASWTQLHFSDFYYYHYDSLTSHDRVLHLIMHCMEGILVCCQRNEFRVSSCILRNGEKIICYSTFPHHSWFYELSCVLSQLFLFPDCKELVYLISYYIHAMLMIILAGFLCFLMLRLQMIPHLTSISFQKDPESLIWKMDLTGLKWKPTYLISPLFFISYGFFSRERAFTGMRFCNLSPCHFFITKNYWTH